MTCISQAYHTGLSATSIQYKDVMLHVARSSAVVSLVDSMEISGGMNLFPWQPIHPASVSNDGYLQTSRRSSWKLSCTVYTSYLLWHVTWFLDGLDLKRWALTLLIPNHESFKAGGRGGNVTSPGFEHVHRFNRGKRSIGDVSGREKNVWNVSQNLYYNRYSVEMFCEINTPYIQEDVLEVLRFAMHD